jgi:thiamine pyrophosphokinase
VCLGGLGGRVDQGLSTLHHLYTFQKEPGYTSGKMFLLSSEAITFVLKAGTHRIQVRDGSSNLGLGKHIGIIPLKEPSIITTHGLEWDVTDWLTEFGGQVSTSNHVKEDWVTIETSKDVLFTIDLDVA